MAQTREKRGGRRDEAALRLDKWRGNDFHNVYIRGATVNCELVTQRLLPCLCLCSNTFE